uniref:Uncharacterized protein n=1 Tax=Tetradesmus obliquus TaxID=3088 RepID=A0A383WMX0_TETOB|eukprot:jgi/Sobl393_1/642/SZX78524.1
MSSSTGSAAARQRSKFTADVIRAIEDLEVRRINRPSQQLADAAWQKLQFDLPVLEVAELQALLDQLRASLQGKTSWPCYILTAKALENITAGAKRSSSFKPEASQQEQQLQQLLQDAPASSIEAKAAGGSSRSSSAADSQQQQSQEQQGTQTQQQLYQQLCAVLLLQYVAKAASLPEQEAWELLAEYQPEQPEEQQQQQQTALQDMQQQLAGMQLDDTQLLEALVAAASGSGAAASHAGPEAAAACAVGQGSAGSTCTSSTCIYELQEAPEQDADDEEYEAIEAAQAPAAATISLAAAQQQQQQQQYSWPALQQKLCSLAEHVHYSLLGYEPLWQQQQAAQHLLQLLRALGVHAHAEDLQQVLHAYVGLLVDRLAAVPADLPLLQQLWEALGLPGGQGVGFKASSSSSSSSSRQQALPSEAVLGFSVAASVWGQLPGTNARGKLWRLMYDNLLPLLEQCSEQLAYNTASSSTKQQQHAAVQGEGFAHALLLCHVVELLLLGRPGAVDVAGQLVQQGVMRSLVVLFGQHAGNAAAEPVRRAVLLASCSSLQAAAWVLAVPAVLQQLQQPSFQLGGAAEAHGAIWEFVISKSSSSTTSSKNGTASSSSSSSGSGSGGGNSSSGSAGQLLALLELDCSNVSNLQRQVALLQLLSDAQQAAGSRQHLWGPAVVAALKQVAARIKALQASTAAAAAAAGAQERPETAASTASGTAGEGVAVSAVEAVAANGHHTAGLPGGSTTGSSSSSSSSSGVEDDAEGKGAKAARRLQQQPAAAAAAAAAVDVDADALGVRQRQQLQPAALKLIKQLLTSGGKTD